MRLPLLCFEKRPGSGGTKKSLLTVISYEVAFHAWDRLEVPVTIEDPFSNRGAGGKVEIVPDVAQAYKSRKKVVRFFRRHL